MLSFLYLPTYFHKAGRENNFEASASLHSFVQMKLANELLGGGHQRQTCSHTHITIAPFP